MAQSSATNSGINIGMIFPLYDFLSRAWNGGTFTETWTYKAGGSQGDTVATVTVVYDGAAKDNVVSITKV
jgi:hypothetical protein